jgi:hypothetical protein
MSTRIPGRRYEVELSAADRLALDRLALVAGSTTPSVIRGLVREAIRGLTWAQREAIRAADAEAGAAREAARARGNKNRHRPQK